MDFKPVFRFIKAYPLYFSFIFLGGILAGLVGLFIVFAFIDRPTGGMPENVENAQLIGANTYVPPEPVIPVILEMPQLYRFLDGAPVESAEEQGHAPFAVVLGNSALERPQSGIIRASLVYEALVEGGVTRLFAVFDGSLDVIRIGPVRSARSYFVDIAKELGSVFAHVGGSPNALRELATTKLLIDIDEIGPDGIYFWRGKDRAAPYNTHVSLLSLKRAYDVKKAYTPLNFNQEAAWQFKDDVSTETRPESPPALLINYSTFNYQVKFEYRKETNDYLRFLAGAVHQSNEGAEIAAKNVIVQFVETFLIDELRLGMKLIGEGESIVCSDGACRKATWKKAGEAERTRYYGSEEIIFNRGLTWVVLFPKGREKDVSF